MSNEGSVSNWINGVKDGDPNAAEAIWERYFSQVVNLAKRKIGKNQSGIKDEEDIALSVFAKFFKAAERGRLPMLKDRDGLWRLLFAFTLRKLTDAHRYESRRKRRDPKSATIHFGDLASFTEFVGDTPPPDVAAMMADDLRTLLEGLKSERQREVVMLKLGGATNEEIADDQACSVRTVERILQEIRRSRVWSS